MRRALVLLGFMLCACSSGGPGTAGGGGGGPGGGSMARVCDALCGWGSRCGRAEAGCTTECNQNAVTYEGKWSAAYMDHVSTCLQTLACDQSEETCVANFAAVDPAFPNIPEVQACMTRRSECTTSTWADDYCMSIAALTTAARAAADACRTKPCTEIFACLKSAGAFNY